MSGFGRILPSVERAGSVKVDGPDDFCGFGQLSQTGRISSVRYIGHKGQVRAVARIPDARQIGALHKRRANVAAGCFAVLNVRGNPSDCFRANSRSNSSRSSS